MEICPKKDRSSQKTTGQKYQDMAKIKPWWDFPLFNFFPFPTPTSSAGKTERASATNNFPKT
jgi:hypothetical protein